MHAFALVAPVKRAGEAVGTVHLRAGLALAAGALIELGAGVSVVAVSIVVEKEARAVRRIAGVVRADVPVVTHDGVLALAGAVLTHVRLRARASVIARRGVVVVLTT